MPSEAGILLKRGSRVCRSAPVTPFGEHFAGNLADAGTAARSGPQRPLFRPAMFRDRSGPYRSNPPEGRAISGMGKCRPGGIHSFPKPSSDEGNVRAKGDGRFRNQKERSPFERRAPFSFPVAPINVYSAIFSKFPFLSILKVVAGRSSSSNRTSFLARFMIFMIVS